MMHKYIGSDVQSLVTLPVFISEPMTSLQKMAEVRAFTSTLRFRQRRGHSSVPNVS